MAAQQGKWLGRQLRDRTLKTLGADSTATHQSDNESAFNPSQTQKQEELPAKNNNEPNKEGEKASSSSSLLAPFEYSDKGKMAYIGGKAAVATVNVPTLGVPLVRARAFFLPF